MPRSLRHCVWTTRVHWTANVHCRAQNSLPLFSTLRHCHSVHASPNYFFTIHFNIIPPHLRLGLLNGLLPTVSPPKPFMHFSSHTCYMPCLSHTASFHTPSTTVWCAEQIMQPFVTRFSAIPSFFRPLRSFLSTLFSDTLGLCSTKFHTQTKDKGQERIDWDTNIIGEREREREREREGAVTLGDEQ